MKNMGLKIAVIGAGYTGLVAALRLAQKGNTVTIYEAGSSIGGLASNFEVEGASLERAYHHLFKTDESIINLAEELGIGPKLEWHDSSVSLYYDGKLYPFKGALDLIRFKPLSLHNRIRAGLVVLFLQRTNNWEKLQHVTAYDWMLRYAGKQVTRVIWEPLLKGKFDSHYDKVSMAWLWARIHIRAQSRETGGEKLGYFMGGFQTFTDALLTELKKLKVEININSPTTSISKNNSGLITIKLANKKVETFDKCIATVPSPVFGSLIKNDEAVEESYLNSLSSIDYLGARLLIFSSSQDISPYYWHNINDLKLPFLVFINHTKLIDKKYYNGKYVYYIATYISHDHELFRCSNYEIEKLWLTGLKQVFPLFDAKKIREKHHFRLANAQHIVDTHYAEKIPKEVTPLKNVYLSNFSQIYPEDRGTNYAVREGERVASLCL